MIFPFHDAAVLCSNANLLGAGRQGWAVWSLFFSLPSTNSHMPSFAILAERDDSRSRVESDPSVAFNYRAPAKRCKMRGTGSAYVRCSKAQPRGPNSVDDVSSRPEFGALVTTTATLTSLGDLPLVCPGGKQPPTGA